MTCVLTVLGLVIALGVIVIALEIRKTIYLEDE